MFRINGYYNGNIYKYTTTPEYLLPCVYVALMQSKGVIK